MEMGKRKKERMKYKYTKESKAERKLKESSRYMVYVHHGSFQ